MKTNLVNLDVYHDNKCVKKYDSKCRDMAADNEL